DAMGGVLYFVDEPYAERNTYNIALNSQFETNTMGTINSAAIKFCRENLRVNVYGGYDNHGDLRFAQPNYLLNSRFNQSSLKASIGYNKKKWVMNVRYNYYNGRIGLAGETEDSIVTPDSFMSNSRARAIAAPSQGITNHFISVENKFFLGK